MKKKLLHGIILSQATVAMVGSLYYGFYGDPIVNLQTGDMFNNINALTPCELCWYARILMYPIVMISLVGIIRKNRTYIYTVIPLTILGLGLEIYHYALQKIDMGTSFFCTFANPCNALEVNYFGFITIPFLCGLAFLIILSCCLVIHFSHKND